MLCKINIKKWKNYYPELWEKFGKTNFILTDILELAYYNIKIVIITALQVQLGRKSKYIKKDKLN